MNLTKFTEDQQRAITTPYKDVLVVAGPGSGKTATMIARIRHLVGELGVEPDRIAAITFTNAAAREIENRLQTIKVDGNTMRALETAPGSLGYVGTLHGFALRMLKRYGEASGYGERMSIISPDAATDLLESKAQSLGCKTPLKKLLEMKRAGNLWKDSIEDLVIRSYFADMKEAGIVDFDALLTEFKRLLNTNQEFKHAVSSQYRCLFVDEVQDSAKMDWDIYASLDIPNKFFVGDPDQAIYSFRGGDVDQMLTYSDDTGTQVITLEENFRSYDAVCFAANQLIRKNVNRLQKKTKSAKGPGGRIIKIGDCSNEGEEIGRVCSLIKSHLDNHDQPKQIAVISRTNAIAYAFQKTMTATGIPTGIPTVQREKSDLPPDWRYAKALVEMMANPFNETVCYLFDIEFALSMGHTPKRSKEYAKEGKLNRAKGRPETIIFTLADVPIRTAMNNLSLESRMLIAEKISELPADASVMDLALAMGSTEFVEKESGEGVSVLTIHGSKGREFDTVFLVGFEEETIPGKRKDVNVEEERRLAYVGLTRARETVYISSVQSRVTSWGAIVPTHESRFVKEITG